MTNPYLEKQVMEEDTITIEDAKQFIKDAKSKGNREDFINIADRSWQEIEKRNSKGKLYGGNDLDRSKRWTKFPLWWSCLQIRRPIVFARLPIPVLKDTQGDDPFGRTACVLGERLTRGILKTFDAFPEFASGIDDFIVTNFGWGRVFYRKKECVEDEKIRLQIVQPPAPQPQAPPDQQDPAVQGEQAPEPMPAQSQAPMFLTPDGQQVDQSQVLEDENGPYLLSGQEITVDDEEVYFEAGMYSALYVDPDARKWNAVNELAFEYQYSYREFKDRFGKETLDLLSQTDIEDHRKKNKPIICYEYHNKGLKEVRWFAENSESFFQPKEIAAIPAKDADGNETGKVDNSDLYGITGFFPCTAPLILNASTRNFWPTPEYFQVSDIIDDIHNIVGRMFLLTKAIRVRFLFDSTVKELQGLIGEAAEGTGLGVPNLEQSLMNGKGTLANLVAYFPVDEMIQGLSNMYTAFEQRLNMFYQVTGISDLIRGQTNPDSDKTFGERQMEGKFALNRIEPFQRKAQEWIKDNYQLLMEMALKMFSDQSIDEYITPQTLDAEDKQRYLPALDLLKSNKRRRFRVDFETDSTIQVNEQWKKKQASELANTLTKAMESTAKVAETQPELAGAELAILKHLIGEFSDGKLFIDDIQDAIEKTIEKVNQPKPPEPNADMEKLKIEGGKLQLEGEKFQFEQTKQTAQDQLKQLQIASDERIAIAKIQQVDRMANIDASLAQYKIGIEQQTEQLKVAASTEEARANLEKEYQRINADITVTREELTIKKEALVLELRKIANKQDVDEFQKMLDARVISFEEQLATAQHELDKQKMVLDEKEKYATEARLQSEHQFATQESKIGHISAALDIALKQKELVTPIETPKAEAPKTEAPKEKRSKITRDKDGNITKVVHNGKEGTVVRDKNGEIIEIIHKVK